MGIRELFSWRSRSRFETLVDQHHQPLYSYAVWLCGDHARAEDLVQEVFVRAWQHLNQLSCPEAGRSWLITILRREHLRWLDKQSNGHQELALDVEHTDSYSAEHELQRYQLHRAILALEPGYMEPMLMQILGGYSIEEISAELALTESAVQSRLYRARQQLQQQLGSTVKKPFEITRKVI